MPKRPCAANSSVASANAQKAPPAALAMWMPLPSVLVRMMGVRHHSSILTACNSQANFATHNPALCRVIIFTLAVYVSFRSDPDLRTGAYGRCVPEPTFVGLTGLRVSGRMLLHCGILTCLKWITLCTKSAASLSRWPRPVCPSRAAMAI